MLFTPVGSRLAPHRFVEAAAFSISLYLQMCVSNPCSNIYLPYRLHIVSTSFILFVSLMYRKGINFSYYVLVEYIILTFKEEFRCKKIH